MRRSLPWLLPIIIMLTGCQSFIPPTNNNTNSDDTPVLLSDSLEQFTAAEFADYAASVAIAEPDYNYYNDDGSFFEDFDLGELNLLGSVTSSDVVETAGFDTGTTTSDGENAKPVSDESEAGDGITNVQEQGVDEGDIVKAHGDYLIVLSRGRLFSIKVREGDTALLEPVFKGPAYPKGFTNGTWYDELLISDDTIVVVGYSYAISATQVGIFDFEADGTITHRQTFFIDSNDYYSSRNYAGRLVNGQLIFYMPYYLYVYSDEREELSYEFPQIRHWKKDNETTEPKSILKETDIYKPVQDSASTLHMLVTCDLATEIDCAAQGVLGPYARSYYVSPDSVYLWVSDTNPAYTATGEPHDPNAYVYTMPLDGSGVGVVQAYGAPVDQFSFKQTDDGYLNVLVQEYGSGDAMWWSQGNASAKLALARFPLSLFNQEPKTVTNEYYQSLPQPATAYYSLQNRFVGDYLLYGTGEGWFDAETTNQVYVVNYTQADAIANTVDIGSSVDRIEVLDANNAVVVGSDSSDLFFTWLGLTSDPVTTVATYRLENASQGETRSHGFFYSGAKQMLGLPIRTGGDSLGYEELYAASAEVLFLSLANNQFTKLGSLSGSTTESDFKDDCKFSCTDWYGNSRPIFYDNRIFALMGYDLVEGDVVRDTMTEQRRINIFETGQND